MEINFAIIHKIARKSGEGVRISRSNECLDVQNELVQSMIDQLDSKYTKRQKFTYAVFSDEETIFQSKFNIYSKNQTSDSFVDFTQKAAGALKRIIETTSAAKGGYLIFAQYKKNYNFLSIFLVRDTKGVNFKKSTTSASYFLTTKTHINMENIAMVCRINMDMLKEKKGSYLTFSNKKDTISSFFINWISIKQLHTNETDTNNLRQLLSIIQLPPNETNKTIFLEKVADYIQKNEYQIHLYDISKRFYGSKSYLIEQCELLNINISPSFKANPAALKNFSRIKASADGIDLIFKRSKLDNRTVKLDFQNNQIIIESEILLKKIQDELPNNDQ